MAERSSPLWLRLAAKSILNIGLVWAMATYLPQYFALEGGLRAVIIVGALLTLMNLFFRPILDLITLPLKLFATILAVIIVNGVFVEVIHRVTLRMDPELVKLSIVGGLAGWILVALILGLGNWMIKEMVKRSGD